MMLMIRPIQWILLKLIKVIRVVSSSIKDNGGKYRIANVTANGYWLLKSESAAFVHQVVASEEQL